MARLRTELSEKLHEFCEHVYFQPPTGKKLEYPCIVYNLEALDVRHADNSSYSLYNKYEITYITRDPDDMTKYRIIELPLCSFNRSFPNDNLYHNTYSLYW